MGTRMIRINLTEVAGYIERWGAEHEQAVRLGADIHGLKVSRRTKLGKVDVREVAQKTMDRFESGELGGLREGFNASDFRRGYEWIMDPNTPILYYHYKHKL